jgi:HEAT repeat protein
MLILCPNCWHELKTTPTKCFNCGSHVDLYSREYERLLVAALVRANAERRAQICWILGERGRRSATPVLMELLHDPDLFVRVAALRAIGEIGDESAITAVEKLTSDQHLALRTVAQNILKILGATKVGPSHRRAG